MSSDFDGEELYQTFTVKSNDQTKLVKVIAERDRLDSWSSDLYVTVSESLNISSDVLKLIGKKDGGKFIPIEKDDNFLLSSLGIVSDNTSVLAMMNMLPGGGVSEDSCNLTDDQEVKLSDKAMQICKMITKANYEVLDLCRNLRKELEDCDIIPDTATYKDVKSNVKFCRTLLGYVALGLNPDVRTSRYGCSVVSEYDLYYRMTLNRDFNDICSSIGILHWSAEWHKLKKERANLRRWLGRIRDQTILNFNLPETPDDREERKAVKTKEQIEQDVIRKLAQSKILSGDTEEEKPSKKTLSGSEKKAIQKK